MGLGKLKKHNCPQCGAAITEDQCPYCGVTFFDFSTITLDKPCWIKFRYGKTIYRAYCYVRDTRMEVSCDTRDYCYANGEATVYRHVPNTTLEMTFCVLDNQVEMKESEEDAVKIN